MKLGVLFSGGKDSTYAAYRAQKEGHTLSCLITLHSENPDSYMFHTPSIAKTAAQSNVSGIPLVIQKTKGTEHLELDDLTKALSLAKEAHHIEGVVTGALLSVYQASRIQAICKRLDLWCFNPLWLKDQIALLKELVAHKFDVIIVGVAAEPLDKSWIGKKITPGFIAEIERLSRTYGINPAGEGGEFETFVLNCPLFKKPLSVKELLVSGSGYSWRAELELQ